MSLNRRFGTRGALLVAALGVAGAFLSQPGAAAHVSVTPDTAQPGERATVAFRVPNERDDSSTVRLEVVFPADRPLASVSPQSVPGWKITVNSERLDSPISNGHGGTVSEAVRSIVWEGGQIPPHQYQEFPVRLGPLPEQGSTLVFKSLQTYSDGEVVRWIDLEEPGAPEPDRPAPSLTVANPQPAHAAEESDADATALVLGGAGLATGLAALAGVVFGRRKPNDVPREKSRHEEPARL
ncbi:hypothetical protein SacmaDRAFT_5486 [Saccharomonospora marina XMU15]|uniref:YncI copper-binding domain-containing protein n=1 Tax=Saccharomonospora marina XMU15 TaxID=882083 RepID=H5X8Z9_9PSEU|nr:YcnI family protein [Saccharomonospora marina]EHR53602.1 hypothetical protein SacmaDRAFT_5486 [Saccharomonospora marina XMU15]